MRSFLGFVKKLKNSRQSATQRYIEPFVAENSARISGRGSGLGLPITKRIIERHGGSISVGPTFNGYTYTKEFTVTLKLD